MCVLCTAVLMVLLSVANAQMNTTTPDPGTMMNMTTKSMMMNSTEGGGMTVAVTTPAMAGTTEGDPVCDQLSLNDCFTIYTMSFGWR